MHVMSCCRSHTIRSTVTVNHHDKHRTWSRNTKDFTLTLEAGQLINGAAAVMHGRKRADECLWTRICRPQRSRYLTFHIPPDYIIRPSDSSSVSACLLGPVLRSTQCSAHGNVFFKCRKNANYCQLSVTPHNRDSITVIFIVLDFGT